MTDGLDLPPITYLTTDSLSEGVGASQVLAYVTRLAERGARVHLHTMEKAAPDAEVADQLRRRGVDWQPHRFGRPGPAGGAWRMLRGATVVRRAELVHARSDLAAASALVARSRRFVWDVRALFADQRIALGSLRPRSAEERGLRLVERRAAQRSAAMITLSAAVIPELTRRHGPGVAPKTSVITTCVDLGRFTLVPAPPAGPLRLVLAGTLNAFYDVPAMLALADELCRRRPTQLQVVTPGPTAWDRDLAGAHSVRTAARPDAMPEVIAAGHVGLSACRVDAGVSLLAAMPTKIGEFLACGRPVVVSTGLGDAAELVRTHRCGAVLDGPGGASVQSAADELEELLGDEGTPARCRALAEAHFDLERAIDALVELYRRVAAQ